MRARNLLWAAALLVVVAALLVSGHSGFAAKRTGDTEIVILSTSAVTGYVEPCG